MKTGEVCYVETARGLEPAVFIRNNKLGKPTVRRLYFALGNPLSVYAIKEIPVALREKMQDLADAVVIVRDEQGLK